MKILFEYLKIIVSLCAGLYIMHLAVQYKSVDSSFFVMGMFFSVVCFSGFFWQLKKLLYEKRSMKSAEK